MPASAFQEAGICGVPYQRVLEGINRVRNLAPAKNQFRLHQLVKRLFQFLPRQPGDGVQQFVMEIATRDGADLCHLPHRCQPIKTRHQRRVQRCWDRQRRQRTLENIIAIPFLQQPAFQHRLGQFLNEQRHAIGASENLVHHLLRQCLAACHPLDQCRAVASAKACERDRHHVRVIRPRRREFGPGSDEQQYPKLRHVLHYGGEQLQARLGRSSGYLRKS